ncbi:cytochrome p450 [Colletotrichum karsti]|uniref:Cytochrome p450 n=1 Tax=Colletotrichum karsti TaxID=1095194 RepID=A0A9P6LFV1_9PEZI|nr:cytochrome p450 [Colletotrichum karsti]KAF9870960.1 cytochrome p450 [Colletotrichum karsti]
MNSPIVQIFLRPFSRPFIFIDDPRETEDILLRRTREFDRAPSTIAFFKPLVPEASMVKLTTPAFREQRRLWQDVMSPQFLRKVVAPNVHRCASELVELWSRKCQLATERPFEALDDLELAAFDSIWIAMLGTRLTGLRDEMNALIDESVNAVTDKDQSVHFSKAPRSIMFHAIAYVNGTIERIMRSPFPAKHHWWIRQSKRYRYYSNFKDKEIDGLITNARLRFEKLTTEGDIIIKDEGDTCAMDLVLRREAIAFAKTGQRSPASTDTAMRDELGMLLVAGHETTAITLGWGLKTLADNQVEQSKLRQTLKNVFMGLPNHTSPSALEILSSSIPYLDGALEEILRFANTVPLLARSATVDTTILGYHVPKGSHIMCNAQFMNEPLGVLDESRSESSQTAWERRKGGDFSMQNISKFMPERWIKKTEEGIEEFDAGALTRLQFSLGVRGCFGRKLAMQQLRIFLVLLVWNFEFLPVPDDLNSRWGHQKILRPPQQCYVRLRKV